MRRGGNTSCKTIQEDIFGNKVEVLRIKGSGWDLDTIEAPGLPAVKLEPILKLRGLVIMLTLVVIICIYII